jgi:hypothetical protein
VILVSEGIVLELQHDCLDSSVPVSAILRKAKAIASKLDLDELVGWFDEELNGYSCSADELPAHRKGIGVPKFRNPYHGWCPILTGDDWFGNAVSTAYLFQPISQLESLAAGSKSDMLLMQYPPAIAAVIHEQLPTPMECALHFPKDQVRSGLDYVRNKVLDWTLALEKKGITGEGFTFDKKEKEEAVAVTNHIYGSNIGVLGSVAGDASVSELSIASNSVDFDEIQKLLDQINQSKGALPAATASALEGPLIELEAGASEENASKVKAAFAAMVPILQGAGGNIVAAGILGALGVS